MRKQKKQIITMLLMIAVLLCGCGNGKTNEEGQKPNESESIQVSTKQDTENLKPESDSTSSEEKEETTQSTIPDNIPESSTNGMWVNSYVDIQQKDRKYETKIYLDSVDATDAELIYFTASVAMTVLDRNVESDFYIVISDNEYKLDMNSKEFSDIGFPKEWTEFLEYGDDEGKTLLESISVSFSNSLENWKKFSFDKYLDDVIIVEEESETEEQKEAESTSEETELNVIASEKYKVDGEDVGIMLSEKGGTLDISIMGNANSEEKASIMLATYVSELKKLTPLNSYSVCVFCDKLFVSHTKNSDGKTNTYGTNADGSMAFSSPDWLKNEITMSESELDSYVGELLIKLVEFSDNISNNSIIE